MWLLIGKWMIAIGLIVGSIIEETIYKNVDKHVKHNNNKTMNHMGNNYNV